MRFIALVDEVMDLEGRLIAQKGVAKAF